MPGEADLNWSEVFVPTGPALACNADGPEAGCSSGPSPEGAPIAKATPSETRGALAEDEREEELDTEVQLVRHDVLVLVRTDMEPQLTVACACVWQVAEAGGLALAS